MEEGENDGDYDDDDDDDSKPTAKQIILTSKTKFKKGK